MTSQDPVEGGLPEPDAFEPEQGTLALVLDGPPATREDWEQAAAAVLRKARRLGPDEPDAEAWDRLTLTTYDGIDVSPLGTPDLLDGLRSSGRPRRAGAWDVRSFLNLRGELRARARAGQRRRAGRPRGRRDLPLGGAGGPDGRRRARPGARRACCSTSPRSSSSRATSTASSRPSSSRSWSSVAGSCRLPAPTWEPTRWAARCAGAGSRTSPRAGRGTPCRSPAPPCGSAPWAWSPTGRRLTTSVPPRPRSSAGPWPPASTTCAGWSTTGSTSTTPWASSSSGMPRPTTSSSPSPSCARPVGCGRGCWS